MPSICVAGAGDNNANGTYTQSGSVWVKDASTSIQWENDGGDRDYAWMLRSYGNLSYQSPSATSTPPTTGWVTVYSTAPAPSVTEGACLVDPYCVAGADNATVNGTYSYNSGSSPTTMYFMSGYWQKVGGTIQIGYNGMQSRYTI